MKKMILGLLLCFAMSLLGCMGSVGPGDGPSDSSGDGLTPTPPVPVFGDFILGVATSNPGASSTAGAKALTANSFKTLSIANGEIDVIETRNAVSDISFEADNQVESKIEFPGVFVVELVHQGTEVDQEFPQFDITQIPFDTYHKFEMKFEKLKSEAIPEDLLQDPLVTALLLDHTFVVEGIFQEAGGNDVNGDGRIGTVPFQIVSDNAVDIEVSSPNGFVVSPDKVNFFFIAFQIEAWFNGILPQLQALSPSDLTGGVAVIRPENSNPKIAQILNAFEDNVERSCKSAPSENGEFDQDDVDGESGSEPL